jgi:signal transduction histidine kinase
MKTIELAQLNSPTTKFSIKDINLWKEISLNIEKNKSVLEEKNITIKNNVYKTIMVRADKLHLEELLDNLLINSAKYSQKNGTVKIESFENDKFVTTSITDSGKGMYKEELAHIFDEFYKVDPSRHDFESSGLGLSICKRIVEQHGGEIWTESPGPGKGSTFYFTLPTGKNR